MNTLFKSGVVLPPGVVMTTSAEPAARGGAVQVILVELFTVIPVAFTPPKVTEVAPVKLVPVIVTFVPPNVEPEAGETEEIVGGVI